MITDIHTHTAGRRGAVLSMAPAEVWRLPADAEQLYSVSLHPWWVSAEALADFDRIVAQRADDTRWRAVGECGLDALCDTAPALQLEGLLRSLSAARDLHKPTVIHCVRRWEALFAAVKQVWGPQGATAALRADAPLIIHGYRRGLPLARSLWEQGYGLSLGEHFRPEVARAIPADRLYTETDESALPIEEIRRRIDAARSH